jgi:hypothetical protein
MRRCRAPARLAREIRAFASRFRADKQTNWLFAALIARFDRLSATTPADFRFG